jgi:pimeloyl-ACP methyl ester carboxylesterase
MPSAIGYECIGVPDRAPLVRRAFIVPRSFLRWYPELYHVKTVYKLQNRDTHMNEKIIKDNGVNLCTDSFGNPDDPAILLIMGAMASMVWWPEEFCLRLAAGGRYVIRYDHRDTGRSTSYEPGSINYSIEDMADDAVRVLNAYEISQVHLAGMSLGGFLSQLIALKHPQLVLTLTVIASERLASEDPNLPSMDPKIPAYHAQGAFLDWSDRQAVIEYMTGGWRLIAGSAHSFDEEMIRALAVQEIERADNLLASMNHALLSTSHFAGDERWYNRLSEIRVPALVIHGTEDPVLPYAHGLALQKELPQATLLTLTGAGHELHRDDWDVIIGAILNHTSTI